MTRQSTVDTLKVMRFSAMAEEFERQLADPDSYSQLSFEDRMGLLVDAEWNRRQVNKYKRLVHAAHFSVPSATVEGIEYYEDRKLDKAQIVKFSTCQYIERGHHIVLTGEDKAYLRQLMKDYLKKNPDVMPEEKAELRSWVMTGHSPYDNPDGLCDDFCHPLDFISAMRFWKDFCPEQPKKAEPDGESQ